MEKKDNKETLKKEANDTPTVGYNIDYIQQQRLAAAQSQYAADIFSSKLKYLGIPDYLGPRNITALPSVRDVIKLLRSLYGKGGQLSRIIYKKAAYPITKFYYEILDPIHGNEEDNDLEQNYLDTIHKLMDTKINLREHLIKIQIERDLSGNVAIFFYPSFKKYAVCDACKHAAPVEEFKNRIYRNGKLMAPCPNCENRSGMSLEDRFLTSWKSAHPGNFIFLNINGLRVKENPYTLEKQIIYVVPKQERDAIRSGDKFIIESTPQIFIDAVINQRGVVFAKDKVAFFGGIHMATLTGRYTISAYNLTYYPRLLPALFDMLAFNSDRYADLGYDLNIIAPSELIYVSSSSDAYSVDNIGLGPVQQALKSLIYRSSDAPVKGIGLSPLPLGKLIVGEVPTQTSQYIIQRKKMRIEELCSAIGLPPELVVGGLQFGASSVSLRNMENEINSDRSDIVNYVNNFMIPNLCKAYDLPLFTAEMVDLRSTDDVQRIRLLMELAAHNKISWSKVRAALGIKKEPRMSELKEAIKRDVSLEVYANLERIKAQTEAMLDQQEQAMNLQMEMAGGTPEAGAEEQQGEGMAVPTEGAQKQEGGLPSPFQIAIQKAIDMAVKQGVPMEQAQQIMEIVSQLIQMPQQQAQEALIHFHKQAPEQASVVEHFYNMVLQEVKAESNLRQPLPKQNEQRRENPV